jgi:hypothetical protein
VVLPGYKYGCATWRGVELMEISCEAWKGRPLRIDPTIYQAIDDETLSIEQVCVAMQQTWPAIERAILETVAADAIAAGFDEADIKRVVEARARLLREGRGARIETARLMLEAGATNLQ